MFLGEVRVSGAAGFNVDMQIKDPTLQSSTTTMLVEPQKGYENPITLGGSGLQIRFKMGGLTGSVSGSGGLKGSAHFGAGLSVSLTAGVLLNGGTEQKAKETLSLPIKFDTKWVPPFFKTTGFAPIGSSSLQVALTATEYIELAYVAGPLSVGLESHVDVIGMTGIGGSSSAAAALVVVEPVMQPVGSRQLKGSSSSSLHLVPGSRVVVRYKYADAAPGERHRLFYAIRHASGRSEGIMQRDFVNSASGNGEHAAEWLVPWQMSLAGQKAPIVFTIRSSSDMMAEPVESSPHLVTAFTESDSLISKPAAGDLLPLDKDFDVVWQPSLLHLFDDSMPAMAPYHGQERTAESVYVSLVSLADGAAGEAPRREARLIARGLPNSGHARVSLNSTALGRWLSVPRKYWLEVHEGRFGSAYGWSAGYLRVARGSSRPVRMSAALLQATKSSPSAAAGSKPYVKLSTALAAAHPRRDARRLQGCDTSAAGGNVPVKTSFAFNGRPDNIFLKFSLTLFEIPIISLDQKIDIPSTSAPTPVGPAQSVCINIAAAAAGAPPGGGGGGSSSSGGANGSGSGASSAVVGGAVGGALLFAALAAGAYYYYYYYSKKCVGEAKDAAPQGSESYPDPYSTQHPQSSITGAPGLSTNPMFHGVEPTRPSMEYSAASQARPSAAGIAWEMFVADDGGECAPASLCLLLTRSRRTCTRTRPGSAPLLLFLSSSLPLVLSSPLLPPPLLTAPYWYCEATGAQVWEQPAGKATTITTTTTTATATTP